jgi:ferredoxin
MAVGCEQNFPLADENTQIFAEQLCEHSQKSAPLLAQRMRLSRRHSLPTEMVRATINNGAYEFANGISILDAARAAGIDIPTLCHDPRLRPIGACRMCLVQVEGRPHPLTACNNQLADGMVISTHTLADAPLTWNYYRPTSSIWHWPMQNA